MSDEDQPQGKFYGTYRGTVLNNLDPEQRGRLLLSVPGVMGLLPTSWAEPCTPLAGPTGPPMGVYMVPVVGAGVWVQFENGDADKPIWIGCRFGMASDVPTLALAGIPADPNIAIQTLAQHLLMLSDMPPSPVSGGIILKSTTGAMIVVNDSGIYIQNGKGASIFMVGPSVTINQGAMVIT